MMLLRSALATAGRRRAPPLAAAAAAAATSASNSAPHVDLQLIPVRHLGFRIKQRNLPNAARPAAAPVAPSPDKKKERIAAPLANEGITAPMVRLIGADGTNHGVMAVAAALAQARAASLDLVMTVATATPPVCRVASLKSLLREIRESLAEKRKSERVRQPKEMRYSARIDAHDLEIKSAKVIEFLKEGRPVRVSVSFTMSVWSKEEPARREVLARVVQQVAEAGVGHCDVSSIRGDGANLYGLFTPTSTPKPVAEVQRVLARLASPIRPLVQKDVASPAALVATAMAAVDGAAPSGVPLESLLPAPEVLAKFTLPGKPKRGDPDGDDDEDHAEKVASEVPGEELGVTRPMGRRVVRKAKKA